MVIVAFLENEYCNRSCKKELKGCVKEWRDGGQKTENSLIKL
jgi:hypothetical protein